MQWPRQRQDGPWGAHNHQAAAHHTLRVSSGCQALTDTLCTLPLFRVFPGPMGRDPSSVLASLLDNACVCSTVDSCGECSSLRPEPVHPDFDVVPCEMLTLPFNVSVDCTFSNGAPPRRVRAARNQRPGAQHTSLRQGNQWPACPQGLVVTHLSCRSTEQATPCTPLRSCPEAL